MKKILLQLLFLTFFVTTSQSQNLSEFVKLESSDQEADDNHGVSVAISGEYIIAGAWHNDYDSNGENYLNNAGSAFIYKYNSATNEWAQEAKLVAADREALDGFGNSVDIDGTYAVVGTVEENAARGAAYVFERNGSGVWVQVEKLVAPVNQASDRFGNDVGISGNTIVIGAHHEDEDEMEINTMQNAGSAYIFTRNSGEWNFAQKIVASDRDVNDVFGYSVGIHDDKIIVGAYRYNPDVPSDEIGGAYAFEYDMGEWKEVRIMKAASPYPGDRFGWSVDVYHPYYIVGAPFHDYDDAGGGFLNNAGAAYIYDASNSWAEDKVVENNRRDQDNLGQDVAINGTEAAVGAPLQDTDIDGGEPTLSSSGAVFIFKKDGDGFWPQAQKLLTGDRFAGDKFGHAVGMDGDNVVGGAPEDNRDEPTPLPSTGAVYVFIDEPLSLTNLNFNDSWSVYPNPTNGEITVTLDEKYADIETTVLNVLGQTVQTRNFNQTNSLNFEIEGSAGIYWVSIRTDDGKFSTIKVVKK